MADLRLIVGSRDVTALMEAPRWSSIDPGGLESMTVKLNAPIDVEPGQKVYLWYGCECVFWGEVNDPGDHSRGSYSTAQLVVVGPGRYAKERRYREIYCDRNLSRWGEMPGPRRTDLEVGAWEIAGTIELQNDDGSSASQPAGPSLTLRIERAYSATQGPVMEAWYDSDDIPIGAVYYDYNSFDRNTGGLGGLGASSNSWSATLALVGNMSASPVVGTSADLADGSGRKTGYVSGGTTAFHALLGMSWTTSLGAVDGQWSTNWRRLAVYGTHGIQRRGDDPGGFYPGDIVLDAMRRGGGGIAVGRIDDSSSYIVRHLVYLDPVTVEQVWLDMAKLMGWHVGVWEPAGFDTQPRLFFCPVPSSATAIASWYDCEDGEAPRARLDSLYDTCRVAYQDAAGKTRYASVTRPSPFLKQSRTLDLSMGVGDGASAETYARFALALAEAASRGGGSCVLPPVVDTPSGPKPSALLRAGRDRIRLRGLPQVASLLETDTRRYDTFHLRRIEHYTDETGAVRSRAEFDSGGDLLETLNARSEEALIVGGVG